MRKSPPASCRPASNRCCYRSAAQPAKPESRSLSIDRRFSLEIRRAIRTTRRGQRNIRVAKRAFLGSRRRRRGSAFHLVGRPNQKKNCECDNQEIDNVIEKHAVGDGGVPGRFRLSQSGVVASRKIEIQIAEI